MSARPASRFAVAVAVAAVLAGCGGSGSDPGQQIKRTVSAYFSALVHHDVTGICSVQTTGYWEATRAQADARLKATGRSPLPTDCHAGFTRLFALQGTSAPASVAVTQIVAHGNAATGTLVSGSRRQAARFVRASGGQWQISCCTGPQLTQQATTTYRVPSGSMEPTLRLGQIVTSDNAAMRARPPRLDEIVVFHPPSVADSATPKCPSPGEGLNTRKPCGAASPARSQQTFIKRVVGLPGDRIALVGGRVVRNGQLASEPFIRPCTTPGCTFRDPITVPPDTYLVLGDNRGASDDSRFWGPVRRAWIIGLVKTQH
jgi:signal peptidase I